MEINIGKHCSLKECNQLDFLPFKCNLCKKSFCLEHKTYDSHKCPISQENNITKKIKCPLCNKKFYIKNKDDPDNIINSHIMKGCAHVNKCKYKKCNVTLHVISCKKCNKYYCIKHRFHKCN